MRHNNVPSEEKVRHGVRDETRGQAAGAVKREVVKDARKKCPRPIYRRMLEAECDRDDAEGTPGKGADWHLLEFRIDAVAQQEPSPKKFLSNGNDDHQPDKPAEQVCPVCRPFRAEEMWLKTIHARRCAEQPLWGNPDAKGGGARKDAEPDPTEGKILPEELAGTPKQRTAHQDLEGKHPIFRFSERPMCKPVADVLHDFAGEQKCKKNEERREISSFVRTDSDHYESIDMNEKDQPSPEQLLKMLDLQMEASRKMRESRGQNRGKMRVMAVVILLAVMGLVLWGMMMFLEQMRPEKPAGSPQLEGSR